LGHTHSYIQAMCTFLYFYKTGVNQTLGEEFCNIVRSNVHGNGALSGGVARQYALSLVAIRYARYTNLSTPKHFTNTYIHTHTNNHSERYKEGIPRYIKRWFNRYLPTIVNTRTQERLVSIAEILSRLHLALFFLNGSYYTFLNRIFGVRYVKTRVSSNRQLGQTQYRFLGYLLLIQIFGSALLNLKRKCLDPVLSLLFRSGSSTGARTNKNTEINSVRSLELPISSCTSEQTCPICASSIVNASATACGHVFCWKCIVPWLLRKPQCPLCRQPSEPKSVLCLYDGGAASTNF